MFFRSPLDKKGFWDTVGSTPSTIDWCEPNYTQSHYLAEYQNAISSLTITFGGLFGLFWAYKYGHRKSLGIFAAFVAIVGLGSFLFHGTLLFVPQLLDELPMCWAISSFYVVIFDTCKSITAVKQKFYKTAKERKDPKLAPILEAIDGNQWEHDPYAYFLCLSPLVPVYHLCHFFHGTIIEKVFGYSTPITLTLINVLLSFLHGHFGFVVLFQTVFGTVTLGSAICIMQLPSLFTIPEENNAPEGDLAIFKKMMHRYKWFRITYFGAALIALFCWLIDNNFCSLLLQNKPYISFHALWHCLSYWSTYSSIVLGAYGLEMASRATVDVHNTLQVVELSKTVASTSAGPIKPVLKMHSVKLTPGNVTEIEFVPLPLIGTMLTGVEHIRGSYYDDIV